jgi:hypothetical protein
MRLHKNHTYFLKNGGGYANERKGHDDVTGCSLDEMNDHSVCFTAFVIFARWSFHGAEFHLCK